MKANLEFLIDEDLFDEDVQKNRRRPQTFQV
jgi:hypothetical protein